jgi:hypothetical protein
VHFDLCFVYTLLQYKFLFKSCFIQILINDSVKCIYSRVSALLNIFFLFFTTNQIKSKVKMSLINSKYWDPSKFSLIKPQCINHISLKKKKKKQQQQQKQLYKILSGFSHVLKLSLKVQKILNLGYQIFYFLQCSHLQRFRYFFQISFRCSLNDIC